MGDRKEQQSMHKDFFDHCQNAINQGFYLEAILMEYAAIEGRLEVILGLLDLPCNKSIAREERKRMSISSRIECLRKMQTHMSVFEKSKLPADFFKKLSDWTRMRNEYVHGLYKDELKYNKRIAGAKDNAEKGYGYCKLLYNEGKRLRRLKKAGMLVKGACYNTSRTCFLSNIKENTNGSF